MHSILIVCVGNICRSPMAEGLFRLALPDKTIRSAGLAAMIGKPADPLAVQLLAEQGIDIAAHRAQNISAQLINAADLILTMELGQRHYLEKHYTASHGKVFRLGEAAATDIADPYRQGIDGFREALRLINDGVRQYARRIEQLG